MQSSMRFCWHAGLVPMSGNDLLRRGAIGAVASSAARRAASLSARWAPAYRAVVRRYSSHTASSVATHAVPADEETPPAASQPLRDLAQGRPKQPHCTATTSARIDSEDGEAAPRSCLPHTTSLQTTYKQSIERLRECMHNIHHSSGSVSEQPSCRTDQANMPTRTAVTCAAEEPMLAHSAGGAAEHIDAIGSLAASAHLSQSAKQSHAAWCIHDGHETGVALCDAGLHKRAEDETNAVVEHEGEGASRTAPSPTASPSPSPDVTFVGLLEKYMKLERVIEQKMISSFRQAHSSHPMARFCASEVLASRRFANSPAGRLCAMRPTTSERQWLLDYACAIVAARAVPLVVATRLLRNPWPAILQNGLCQDNSCSRRSSTGNICNKQGSRSHLNTPHDHPNYSTDDATSTMGNSRNDCVHAHEKQHCSNSDAAPGCKTDLLRFHDTAWASSASNRSNAKGVCSGHTLHEKSLTPTHYRFIAAHICAWVGDELQAKRLHPAEARAVLSNAAAAFSEGAVESIVHSRTPQRTHAAATMHGQTRNTNGTTSTAPNESRMTDAGALSGSHACDVHAMPHAKDAMVHATQPLVCATRPTAGTDTPGDEGTQDRHSDSHSDDAVGSDRANLRSHGSTWQDGDRAKWALHPPASLSSPSLSSQVSTAVTPHTYHEGQLGTQQQQQLQQLQQQQNSSRICYDPNGDGRSSRGCRYDTHNPSSKRRAVTESVLSLVGNLCAVAMSDTPTLRTQPDSLISVLWGVYLSVATLARRGVARAAHAQDNSANATKRVSRLGGGADGCCYSDAQDIWLAQTRLARGCVRVTRCGVPVSFWVHAVRRVVESNAALHACMGDVLHQAQQSARPAPPQWAETGAGGRQAVACCGSESMHGQVHSTSGCALLPDCGATGSGVDRNDHEERARSAPVQAAAAAAAAATSQHGQCSSNDNDGDCSAARNDVGTASALATYAVGAQTALAQSHMCNSASQTRARRRAERRTVGHVFSGLPTRQIYRLLLVLHRIGWPRAELLYKSRSCALQTIPAGENSSAMLPSRRRGNDVDATGSNRWHEWDGSNVGNRVGSHSSRSSSDNSCVHEMNYSAHGSVGAGPMSDEMAYLNESLRALADAALKNIVFETEARLDAFSSHSPGNDHTDSRQSSSSSGHLHDGGRRENGHDSENGQSRTDQHSGHHSYADSAPDVVHDDPDAGASVRPTIPMTRRAMAHSHSSRHTSALELAQRVRSVSDLEPHELLELLILCAAWGVPFSVPASRVADALLTPLVRQLNLSDVHTLVRCTTLLRCGSPDLICALSYRLCPGSRTDSSSRNNTSRNAAGAVQYTSHIGSHANSTYHHDNRAIGDSAGDRTWKEDFDVGASLQTRTALHALLRTLTSCAEDASGVAHSPVTPDPFALPIAAPLTWHAGSAAQSTHRKYLHCLTDVLLPQFLNLCTRLVCALPAKELLREVELLYRVWRYLCNNSNTGGSGDGARHAAGAASLTTLRLSPLSSSATRPASVPPVTWLMLSVLSVVDTACAQLDRLLQLEVCSLPVAFDVLEYTLLLGMRKDATRYPGTAALWATRNAAHAHTVQETRAASATHTMSIRSRTRAMAAAAVPESESMTDTSLRCYRDRCDDAHSAATNKTNDKKNNNSASRPHASLPQTDSQRWDEKAESDFPARPRAAQHVYSALLKALGCTSRMPAHWGVEPHYAQLVTLVEMTGLYNLFLGASLLQQGHLDQCHVDRALRGSHSENDHRAVTCVSDAASEAVPTQSSPTATELHVHTAHQAVRSESLALPQWVERRVSAVALWRIERMWPQIHTQLSAMVRTLSAPSSSRASAAAVCLPSHDTQLLLHILGQMHCDTVKLRRFVQMVQHSPLRLLRQQRVLWLYMYALAKSVGDEAIVQDVARILDSTLY